MSGFFDKLVGRTLGIMSAPRPALLPLFAPEPTQLANDLPRESEQEVVQTTQEEGRHLASSPVVESYEAERMPTNVAQVRHEPIISTRQETAIISSQQEPGSLFTQRSPQSRVNTPSESAMQARQSVPGEQGQIVRPLAPFTVSEQRSETSALLAPVVSARRPTQDLQQSETAASIRISIGRIEVRAVYSPSAQSPKTQPAPRAPQPSLEAYLQARNRGKS